MSGFGVRSGIVFGVRVQFCGWLKKHLDLLDIRAVPAVGLGSAASLPVLVEGDGPQGDEGTEEDSSSIVKEDPCLNAPKTVACRYQQFASKPTSESCCLLEERKS